MNTKTINAENLRLWDIIVLPANSQTKERRLLVSTVPRLDSLKVSCFAFPIRNGETATKSTPIQFGRMVSIQIEDN